jgi:hypothetical protein
MAACVTSQGRNRLVIWTYPDSLATREDVVQAATVLREVLVTRSVYPDIQRKCFGVELEQIGDGTYDFAVRFNEYVCGGDSPSNLLDRYRVASATGTVLWYDSADEGGSFKPLDARVREQ